MPEGRDDVKRTIASALRSVLVEAFEGVPPGRPTWFIDGAAHGSLLGQLGAISAAEASHAQAGRRTVAAHAEHARFHLDVIARFIRGDRTPANWDDSWRVSAVDESEWRDLRDRLRGAYRALLDVVDGTDWDELSLSAAVGATAHAAYHLGAIRQMAKGMEERRDTTSMK